MFLKQLKINGFKSFAKPIVIKFNTPLTAIVGPNGSGKSNIVDAIRWVLGEQSAKALRGNKMADIIFSGSKTHKALSKASVHLCVDNSDRTLDVNSNEVVIGRQVDDNGESDYFLNGEVCRLKDINKMLLDTGMGKDLYSIVGQGKIDSIINSKPEKLRELFEEAAGISRHKSRKQEAEKKLQKTRQNLQRVNDIIKELKSQLKPLKKEAEKAKKYENINSKLRKLEISLLIDKWEKNRAEYDSVKIDRDFLEEKLQYKQKRYQGLENDISDSRALLQRKQENMEKAKEELFKLRSRKNELNNKINIYKERKNNLLTDLENISQWKDDNKKDTIKSAISQLNDKIKDVNNNCKYIEDKIKLKIDKLNKTKEKIKKEKERLNNLQDDMINEQGNINDIKNKIEIINEKIKYNEEKINNLKQEKESIVKQLHIRKKAEKTVKEELDSLIKSKKNAADNIIKQKQKLDKKTSLLNRKEDELKALNQKLNKKTSRLNVLKELDNNYDGYYYGVKNSLKAIDKFTGIKGIVANLIKVKKQYVQAVETALGGRIQNLVVESDNTAVKIINYLKKNNLGYATFLPVNLIKGKKIVINNRAKKIDGYIGIASNYLDYDNYLEGIINYLLGNTIIAENIESAAEITKVIKSKYKIVTLDGEIIRTGGAVTGGSKNKQRKSLISRSREKKNLKNEIKSYKDEVKQKERNIVRLDNEITELINMINKNKEIIHQLELDENSINSDLNGIINDINKLKKKKEENISNVKEIKQELSNLYKRKEKNNKIMLKTDNDNQKDKNLITKVKNDIEVLREKEKDILECITDLKVKFATGKQKKENFIEEKNKAINELTNFEQKLQQKNKLYKIKKEKKISLNNNLKEVKKELSDCQRMIKEKDNTIAILKKTISKKEEKVDKLIRESKVVKDKIANLKEQFHEIELKLSRLENKYIRSRDRLQEEYQINPNQDKVQERIKISNYNSADRKVAEFKRTIKSMGIVNRGAREEYKKIKERVDYLVSQKEDLLQARNSIKEIINEIEVTMGDLFYQSYKNVKKQFENIFSDLFSGGKANLTLSNPDNLLSTGVEISAQPPGKKLKKLSLMSGGERALTAIALVFAFLNENPSPFYILDEIDAPLDDANVMRFGEFIKKYSKFAQFVIITHRKHMMTRAGTIYGVTMQDRGISKLVSLDMNKQGGKIYGYI